MFFLHKSDLFSVEWWQCVLWYSWQSLSEQTVNMSDPTAKMPNHMGQRWPTFLTMARILRTSIIPMAQWPNVTWCRCSHLHTPWPSSMRTTSARQTGREDQICRTCQICCGRWHWSDMIWPVWKDSTRRGPRTTIVFDSFCLLLFFVFNSFYLFICSESRMVVGCHICVLTMAQAVSWGLILGIMMIVAVAGASGNGTSPPSVLGVSKVKRMPYPYRAILDAGVCAGLSWGMGGCLGKIQQEIWGCLKVVYP